MEPRVSNLILDNDAIVGRSLDDAQLGPPLSSLSHNVQQTSELLLNPHAPSCEVATDVIDPRLFQNHKRNGVEERAQISNIALNDLVALNGANQPTENRNISWRDAGTKTAPSSVPLAGVLNQSPPPQVDDRHDGESRKKRRLDSGSTRILPKPASTEKRPGRRQQTRPLLPPLLAPLHEPPPNARIVPSIVDGTFARPNAPLEASMLDTETTPPQNKTVSSDLATSTVQERLPDRQRPETIGQTKRKKRWTEPETRDLLRGVARFGIGSWKKILLCLDYKFVQRTAVDLKDRFRTCCPEQYKGVGNASKAVVIPARNADKDSSDPSTLGNQLVTNHKTAEVFASIGIDGPFPKRKRRGRRQFTQEEDDALLAGFRKHQAQWKRIQQDAELNLQSRSRTDLRDRFRNRFPALFVDAGYKPPKKATSQPGDRQKYEASTVQLSISTNVQSQDRPNTYPGFEGALAAPAMTQSLPYQPAPAVAQPRAMNLLNPLNPSSIDNLSHPSYVSDTEAEDPSAITLSRNIFDWANQHSKANKPEPQSQMIPKTISRLDQFHINPLLALKVPHSAPKNAVPGIPHFPLPALPLAGILNGPVSLPPPSRLISDFDIDLRTES